MGVFNRKLRRNPLRNVGHQNDAWRPGANRKIFPLAPQLPLIWTFDFSFTTSHVDSSRSAAQSARPAAPPNADTSYVKPGVAAPRRLAALLCGWRASALTLSLRRQVPPEIIRTPHAFGHDLFLQDAQYPVLTTTSYGARLESSF